MGKVAQQLTGLFSGGRDNSAADSAAKARAERQISNDRVASDLQADEARKTGSRKVKKGRRLFIESASTLG
ncbi:MAG: hypothetical protein JJ891_16815 [Rhizobiaceae bacterium]|jgi:hypothetical protein|nr:hypothetical protein [Rhizobiaceae bacterium]